MYDTRRLKRLFWRFCIKLCGNNRQSCFVPDHHYTSSAWWLLFVLWLIFISADRTFCILNYYYDKNCLINQQNLLVEREREKPKNLSSAAVEFTFACSFVKSARKSSVYLRFDECEPRGAISLNKNMSRGQPTLNIQFRRAFYFRYFAAWFLSALRVLQSSTQMFTIPFEIDW